MNLPSTNQIMTNGLCSPFPSSSSSAYFSLEFVLHIILCVCMCMCKYTEKEKLIMRERERKLEKVLDCSYNDDKASLIEISLLWFLSSPG